MRRKFWVVSLLTVTLAATTVRAEEPAARYKVGDTFNQEVVVSRKSVFRVIGLDVEKWAQYSIASSFKVTTVNADGSLAAEQTIRVARLTDADPDLRATLAAALAKTQGIKMDLTVSPTGKVTELKGLKDSIQVQIGGDLAVGQSLRLWSVLDADGWKELGGLTFFQPEKPIPPDVTLARLAAREKWERDAAHDWGLLGNWKGKTVYAPVGRQPGKSGLERIEYGHNITYTPPATKKDTDLPLRVVKANFKTLAAGGVILYDPAARKTAAAEEAFRVRGTVVVSVGGVEATIEMEELQGFRLAVNNPAVRTLTGQPPGRRAPPK